MGKNFKNPILFMEFSENFVKARPVSGVPVKPRTSGYPSINRGTIVRMVKEGFGFYRNFEYNKGLPVVEKFVLRENSLAKSLRYSFLETAKISLIGSAGNTGFLFPVADDSELERICSVMRFSRSKSFEASLTHIENIGGFYPNEKLEISHNFVKKAVFDKSSGKTIRFKCFPFPDTAETVAGFLNKLGAHSLKIHPQIADSIFIEAYLSDYKPKLTTILNHSYICEISEPEMIEITEHYLRHEDLFSDCVMEKKAGEAYPAVGIIDSGVAENSFLRKWESGKELFVEKELIDPAHGTFVTGRALACGESFGGTEFLDVTVMPGRNGTPPDLARLAKILRTVVPKYRDKIKIWNLSLGTNITAGENISLFAYLLDCIQREQDVLFILPAGNYSPLRDWNKNEPRAEDIITIPAESLFALTVGSVSHTDTNLTPFNSPSLFTRRGRGAFSSVKPELVYYGGTHEYRFGKNIPKGVFSIGKYNEIAEDTGTSHASPSVAGTAAKLYTLLDKAATVDTVKALLIHKAAGEAADGIYTGWGLPETPEKMMTTDDDTITIIHTGIYKKGSFIETSAVPVPPEMICNGRFTGTVRITLSYRPPVSIAYAGYYTCVNLKASLGYYKNGKWTGLVTDKHLKYAPADPKAKSDFLWLPLKDYHASVNTACLFENLFLRLTASKRDFFKEPVLVPYAAVISFICKSSSNFKNFKDSIKENNTVFAFLEI